MGESKEKLIKAIKHYQDSVERHSKTGKNDKLLHAIEKLARLPIRVCHLEETGVGRTVNGLKKFEGKVGEGARSLVDKWKSMVKGEEDEEQARLEQEQRETLENEIVDEDPDPESLQIVDQEEIMEKLTSEEFNNSSHRKSNGSDKHSYSSSRHSNRDKRSRSRDKSDKKSKHHSNNDSDNSSDSDSDHRSKKHKSDKSDRKSKNSSRRRESDSDSESDESDSSSESSSSPAKDKNKSKHSSSESSSDRSSSDSEKSSSDDSSSDRKYKSESHNKRARSHKEPQSSTSESDGGKTSSDKHNRSKEKSSKSKKSSSDSDKDYKDKHSKSKEKHNDSKNHPIKFSEKPKESHSKSKDNKSDKHDKYRESSSKKESSSSKSKTKSPEAESRDKEKSKSRDSERDSKKSGKSENKKEDSKRDSSESYRDKGNGNSLQEKKRSREVSKDRDTKRHKADSFQTKERSNNDQSTSSKSREKEASNKKKNRDSSKEKKDRSETDSTKKPSSDSTKSLREKDKAKMSTPSSTKINTSSKKLLEGIDSGSGASFADVLGMLETPVHSTKNKKRSTTAEEKQYSDRTSSSSKGERSSKSRSSAEDSSSPSKDTEKVPNLLKDPGNLEPLDINISSLLPSITPNYRPLGQSLDNQNKKMWTDDEALSRVISAKHQRTKVYSGNKSSYTKVPSLFEICSRILQDNLDALEYTGGVPYSILKPILEKANPDQLYQLEFHNPYLIEDTDELWQLHCQKEFRNKKREELESWREMYMRCLDEREAKLKALTANIKQSQDRSIPVRQTKLAYVDSVVKPPRNIAKKQARNGTAVDIKRPSQTPTERLSQLAKSGEAAKTVVPNPGRAKADRSSSSTSHSSHLKPKKAPLMAKTLSLLKNRFGRR